MSYLNDSFGRARDMLAARPKARATDAVKHDSFDAAMFRELLDEAPALAELADEDLGQSYDHTRDMVREVVMSFWQGDPTLRGPGEMEPSRLLNHGVANDVLGAPETAQTRTMTKHDRYGAAMATIAVSSRVKDFLDNANQAQQAAQEAEQAQQEHQDALDQLESALDGLSVPGGGPGGQSQGQDSPGGDEDGEGAPEQGGDVSGPLAGQEGPLTEQQAEQVEQLLEQLAQVQEAELRAAETLAEAQAQAGQVARKMRPAVREAVTKAGEQLADELDLFSSWGVEDGTLIKLSFAERQQLASALRTNRLAKFRKLVGRFRVMAAASRVRRTEYARDEVYSVEMSDRLPDVMASEYALLGNRHTRLDFLQRLAEGQLLSRKYRGVEKLGDGAIGCLVDCSGSMKKPDATGVSREAYAKAFALALLDQARAAGRDFFAINFSSQNQQKLFFFPKGRGEITEVMEFVEHFFDGGTDYQRPMDMATDVLERGFNATGAMRADLVMITDDDCRVSSEWLAAYQARKDKLGFRTFGVAIGTHAGNALASLSDDVRSIFEFTDPTAVADILRTV